MGGVAGDQAFGGLCAELFTQHSAAAGFELAVCAAVPCWLAVGVDVAVGDGGAVELGWG